VPKVRSIGVTLFGYILIICSLYQMLALAGAGYQHYLYLHQEYDKNMILVRYIFSWFIKIVGLVSGIGILNLKDIFRKLAILNSLLIICTVNLKHTYGAYLLHAQYLDKLAATYGFWPYDVSFTTMVLPALKVQRAIDIIFGVLLIYFFTRPAVEKQFQD